MAYRLKQATLNIHNIAEKFQNQKDVDIMFRKYNVP